MKLTAENVRTIFTESFFLDDEDTSNAVLVDGVLNKYGFHPERLESHKTEIAEMLAELPEQFHSTAGGGWSFLNACVTKDGVQWGEHVNIEQLLVLGLATGQAKIIFPRDMWPALPGGLPYFSVL